MDWRSTLMTVMILLGAADSFRILAFFPFPARSHHFIFRPVLEELARRGHQIVYVTSFPYDKIPSNITQVNIGLSLEELFKDKKLNQVEFGEKPVPISVMMLYEIGFVIGETALKEPQVQKLIHSNEKFDGVMFESYFVQEYLSAFIHKFGAVGIEIMPLGDCGWVNELSALPDNVAYQIDYKNENNNDLDFWERLYNTYIKFTLTAGSYFYLWKMQGLMDKYFNYTGWESRPRLTDLVANRSIILTNSHFAVGYSVPLAPHRKEIGGINVRPNKDLPQDLQKYMDEAKDGVIYMSLGSNIKTTEVTTTDLQKALMAVFGELRQKVLMKWESDYTDQLPPNVKLSKWFPQQDILAHKNLKLFITHGGLLSINEAVHNAVPLIGIPFFGDQAKNLKQVEHAGYGVMLRFRNLTKESIRWAVNEVLNNKRYKTEAVRRSGMFRNRRVSPSDEAADWVEFAIKYPNALTPKGAFLPFFVLHNLDICLFFYAVAAVVGLIAVKLLCVFYNCICQSKKKGEPKKKVKKQ